MKMNCMVNYLKKHNTELVVTNPQPIEGILFVCLLFWNVNQSRMMISQATTHTKKAINNFNSNSKLVCSIYP